MPAPNGFWLYRVDAKGQDGPATWETLPWPARRILFKQRLHYVMP
jgi:hypothetical protein